MPEQLLVRGLPDGTKAALRARAARNDRTVEAEARRLLIDALASDPPSIVDLLRDDAAGDVEFEPVRLGLRARTVDW